MARLCAEFGISRKTGYKVRDRYERCGLEALTDRSGGRIARPISSRACSSARSSWALQVGS
jgi:transposase